MSACHHQHSDWVLCTSCLPAIGTLFYEKRCSSCGFAMVKHEGPAPSTNDVYELEFHLGGCRKCPEENANVARVPEIRRRVRGWVFADIPLVATQGCELVVALGRGIGAGLHRAAHRAQAALGDRKCLLCHRLTSNQFRPISFSLRKSRSVQGQAGSKLL